MNKLKTRPKTPEELEKEFNEALNGPWTSDEVVWKEAEKIWREQEMKGEAKEEII